MRIAQARRHRPAVVALLLALTAVLLFGVVPAAFAKQSLGLSSASFKFEASAGQAGKGEVFLTNEGDQPIKVMVYAADQKVDPKGGLNFIAPNHDTTNFLDSPASWVRMELPKSAKSLGNTPYLELKAHERVPVKFQVDIPSGAVPGDKQIMLFFEVFELQSGAQSAQSRVSGRIGARVVARIKGELTERMEVRPFTVPGFVLGDSSDYSFTVMNGSNVDKRVSSKLMVLDGSDRTRAEAVAASDTVVFAGTSLQKSGKLSFTGLGPGKYTIRLVTSYSREAQNQVPGEIAKTRDLWLIPLWLALAAGILVLILLVGFIWWLGSRSGRKRAQRRDGSRGESSGAAGAPDEVQRAG